MLPRTYPVVLSVMFLFFITASYGLADPNYEHPGDFHATGTAINIDTRAENFDLVDKGETYTVITDHATIQLSGGHVGSLRDLRDSAYIRVMGEQLSERTVLASVVIILDDTGKNIDADTRGYRSNDKVDTDGYVTRVQPRYNEITFRTQYRNYVVIVKPNTVIRHYIYVTDIDDIDEGDDLTVIGVMDPDGRIIADRIQINSSSGSDKGRYSAGKRYRPDSQDRIYREREDIIEGIITYPATSFDRTFAMDTRYGERKVDVPKSAEVIKYGENTGVRSLGKGLNVRVYGTWDGNTMIAGKVETIDKIIVDERHTDTIVKQNDKNDNPELIIDNSRDNDEQKADTPLTGRITSIDAKTQNITIGTGLKDTLIDARNASITRKGSMRRFSDLKSGDKVEVKGRYDGDTFIAASVDVVE